MREQKLCPLSIIADTRLSFDSSKDRGEFNTKIGVKKVIQGKPAFQDQGIDMGADRPRLG